MFSPVDAQVGRTAGAGGVRTEPLVRKVVPWPRSTVVVGATSKRGLVPCPLIGFGVRERGFRLRVCLTNFPTLSRTTDTGFPCQKLRMSDLGVRRPGLRRTVPVSSPLTVYILINILKGRHFKILSPRIVRVNVGYYCRNGP